MTRITSSDVMAMVEKVGITVPLSTAMQLLAEYSAQDCCSISEASEMDRTVKNAIKEAGERWGNRKLARVMYETRYQFEKLKNTKP